MWRGNFFLELESLGETSRDWYFKNPWEVLGLTEKCPITNIFYDYDYDYVYDYDRFPFKCIKLLLLVEVSDLVCDASTSLLFARSCARF